MWQAGCKLGEPRLAIFGRRRCRTRRAGFARSRSPSLVLAVRRCRGTARWRRPQPPRSTAEPSWHRRARRARQHARAVVAVTQARDLLSRHHGGGGPAASPSAGLMGRGRWGRDDDGWQSRRGRSASRGRGRWGDSSGRDGQKYNDRGGDAQEVKRLRKELDDVKRRNGQQAVAHPHAKEGPPRDGDWICHGCGFGTNRATRQSCFRCTAAKGASFPPGSRHVAGVALGVAGGGLAATGLAATPAPTHAAVLQSASPPSSASSAIVHGMPSGTAAAATWPPAMPPAPTILVPGFTNTTTTPSAAAATTAPFTTTSPPVGGSRGQAHQGPPRHLAGGACVARRKRAMC